MQLTFTILPLLAALASAAPAADIFRRAEATCGSVYYSASAVNAASVAACNYFRAGNTAGSSSYPHRYNNYEGFKFGGAAGPYQEFPIMSNGQVYSGGSPGPDRVVITESSCRQAGTITHTGASGNNFVACKGTS
ncbi:ribonuclease-domain-containing protein [Sarocladium strictum]